MRRALVTAVLVLAACAASSPQGPTPHQASSRRSEADAGLICRDETPTGTNFTHRVCRTPEEIEKQRQEAEELWRNQASARIRRVR